MSPCRAERLLALLADAELDLLLVTNLVNVRYLTGYTGSNGLALIGAQTRVFVTDFRYVEQAAEEVKDGFDRRTAPRELLDELDAMLPGGELRLGFEDANLSVRKYERLRELLPERVTLVAAGSLVERLRAVKTPGELARIRAAAALADAALSEILRLGLSGRNERGVALALESQLRTLGARRPSFDSIVAGGPHGALPHASPREVPLERGHLVVFDWGAELDGYCSDCTRTIAIGDVGAEAQETYELVLAAQLAGLEAVGPGVSGRDADAAARQVIADGGQGEHFGHGLGHGVGLEVHEGPRLSQRSSDELAPGNVVTVEPGVYLPGRFGIRIEDLVVLTEDGREVLTGLPKELTVVD